MNWWNKLAQAKPNPPRVFYRGTDPNPKETRRISTGTPEWDDNLFVSSDPEMAKGYGTQIEEIHATPQAKILYQGHPPFGKVCGRGSRSQTLLDYCTQCLRKAKAAGYHAVHFQLQGTIGTAIMDPSLFLRNQNPQPQNYTQTPKEQA